MIRYHKPPFLLREFKIEVTHRCSLNCIHCSSDATPACDREMTEEDCLRIIREAAEMGATEVAFSGGEPLLWPGLDSAVGKASEAGLQVTIYTSGNAANVTKRLRALRPRGVSTAVFSVFASAAEAHERVTRVRGSFGKTTKAVRAAVKAGLAAEVHFVPLADNYRSLPDIARLGKKLGASKTSVLRFVPQGRGALLERKALDRRQNLELKRTILRLRDEGFEIRTGSPYNFLMLNDQPKCCSGIDRLIIGPDTRIYPCDAFKQVGAEELVGTSDLCSLDGTSLRDCWERSPYLLAVREYLTTPFAEPCASCKALERCLSGCLAQKAIAHGNLDKRPDPDCLRGAVRRRQ